MQKEKVVVTGGAGFIGSHIVDLLVAEGYEVHVIDNLHTGKVEDINKEAIFHEIDIRERDSLFPIFENAKYVFHDAALTQIEYSRHNPIETNTVNLCGFLNVLDVSRVSGVKRFIFASSNVVYGDNAQIPTKEEYPVIPSSPYGVQKSSAEMYCKLYSDLYDIETVSLRYFSVYGPRQRAQGAYASVIPSFVESRKTNDTLIVTGDGEQTRDFVNVLDVAKANILAMKSEKVGKGEIINIGCGESACSVNCLAKLIGGNVAYVSPRVEPKHTKADITKAKELLGWEPEIKMKEGIEELLKINGII